MRISTRTVKTSDQTSTSLVLIRHGELLRPSDVLNMTVQCGRVVSVGRRRGCRIRVGHFRPLHHLGHLRRRGQTQWRSYATWFPVVEVGNAVLHAVSHVPGIYPSHTVRD